MDLLPAVLTRDSFPILSCLFSPFSSSFAFSFAFLGRHFCPLSYAFSFEPVFLSLLTSFWLLKLLFLLGLCAVAFCIPDEHLFPGTFHFIS